MCRMRPLTDHDLTVIRRWPPYPGDMEQMDYALRERGWLDEFRHRQDAFVYAVEKDEEVIGFTILAVTGAGEAEFRIALRADRTGRGLGEGITMQTLQFGFTRHGLSRIHLIVRKNNERGIRLYRRIGFADRGECRKNIQGQPVEFWSMEIDCGRFFRNAGYAEKGDAYVTPVAAGLDRDRRAE